MATVTSYDAVTYPSLLFQQSSPDHLAVLARLHGIAAPSIETARVLHIGGGDGLDVIALAAAYPDSRFVNFDLAAQPIARGQRWSEAAGLTNVRHLVLDILDAADRLDGPFDYIVAHGVYAWVPDVVRAAIMPLIRRLLSPGGVAFVSYNALPGGYGRMAVRDMMLHHVGHIADPAAQIAAAKKLLQDFVTPGKDDAPSTTAMRREAAVALTYADGLLYHDQLNGCYAPQSLSAVVDTARQAGLRYLGDVRGSGVDQGFVDPDKASIDDRTFVRHLQTMDYRTGRYFRASLFVQGDLTFSRAVDHAASATMWATTRARLTAEGDFQMGGMTLRIDNPRHARMLAALIERGPGWHPVSDVAADEDLRQSLCRRAIEHFVDLHAAVPPFTLQSSDYPVASALARSQVQRGERRIATLDHRLIDMDNPAERALLPLLDGTRSLLDLARAWQTQPYAAQAPFERTLTAIAGKMLLSR